MFFYYASFFLSFTWAVVLTLVSYSLYGDPRCPPPLNSEGPLKFLHKLFLIIAIVLELLYYLVSLPLSVPLVWAIQDSKIRVKLILDIFLLLNHIISTFYFAKLASLLYLSRHFSKITLKWQISVCFLFNTP